MVVVFLISIQYLILNIGNMPTLYRKASNAPKGNNHRINSANSETAAKKKTTSYL